MTENQIEKVAEKVGLAVDRLQPVAEELVHQVQMWGLFRACAGAVCLTLFFYLFWFMGIKRVKDIEDDMTIKGVRCIMFIVVGFFLGLAGIISITEGLHSYIAPLTRILKL